MEMENGKYTSEVDNITKDVWSGLLELFTDANIYQTSSYGEIHWGENNLSHFVLKNGEDILGIAQVYVQRIPLLKAGVAYIYWGPLWRRKGEEDNLNNLNRVLHYLKLEYVVKRGLLLRIVPRIIANGNMDAHQVFVDNGFRKNTLIFPYRTFLVDLTPPLDTIRKSLDAKWRNHLTRAEKNNIKMTEGKSIELYDIFWRLQKEMLERKNYSPGVDYEKFRVIQQNLPDEEKMIIFTSEYEGEAATATIYTAQGDTAIYILGASGQKGLKSKGAYLSQWMIIRQLKEMGIKWYDLGGINPETNPGVYNFKAGLKGRDAHFLGVYEACENTLSAWLMKMYTFWSERKKEKRTNNNGDSE